jgi:hypothetical protein
LNVQLSWRVTSPTKLGSPADISVANPSVQFQSSIGPNCPKSPSQVELRSLGSLLRRIWLRLWCMYAFFFLEKFTPLPKATINPYPFF